MANIRLAEFLLIFVFQISAATDINNNYCDHFIVTRDPYGPGGNVDGIDVLDSEQIQCKDVQLPMDLDLSTDDSFEEILLTVVHSNITEVIADSFQHGLQLTSMKLSNNYIKKLKVGAFNGLQSLQNLYLSRNELIELPAEVFNSLQNLRVLDVSVNKIKYLHPNFLEDTIHLTVLNLSQNALTFFDDISLGQNHYLKQLNLSENQISQLTLNRSSHRIENLNVSKNKLGIINICLPGLVSLNISHNQIHSLLANKCSVNMTIKTLDISDNLLNEVSVKNISYLTPLNYLNLGGNSLSFIPSHLFVKMNNLKYLDVSRNKLQELEYGIFDNLRELQFLDLSHNSIKLMNRYFHALSLLTTLKINDNKIIYIDSEMFYQDLTSLQIISLDKNEIPCKQLLEIIHILNTPQRPVLIDTGTSTNGSNIQGISCMNSAFSIINSEIKDDITDIFKKTISLKLEKSNGNDLESTVMYNYFNKDFKNSNFYKYLESLKDSNSQNTDRFDKLKYFNEEFENSKFYKFLNSLKASENSTVEFSRNIYKYLEELKNDLENRAPPSDVYKSAYLQGSSETNSGSYYGMFSVVIILLIILVVIKVIHLYIAYNKNKFIQREQVELIGQV